MVQAANRRGVHLTLHCSENDIEAQTTTAESSLGVLVWDDADETGSALILNANRVHNHTCNVPTVLILMVERCAVNGNIILNSEKNCGTALGQASGSSLDLFAGFSDNSAMVAVSGNVFQGKTIIPFRPSGLPDWDTLNAES